MNEISGKGEYTWVDGSTYFGEVKNGMRHGTGRYINPSEGVEYEGQWTNGLRQGQGVLKYKNGAYY